MLWKSRKTGDRPFQDGGALYSLLNLYNVFTSETIICNVKSGLLADFQIWGISAASTIYVMADEEAHQEKRFENEVAVQSMIDISANRLEGLRTQCATSVELTQQEIRTLEVRVTYILKGCMWRLWL